MAEKTVYGKAADLIVQHGWTTGTPRDEEGCLCAGGAIALALGFRPDEMYEATRHPELDRALHKLADYVGVERDGLRADIKSGNRVYLWNDLRASGEDEVLQTLQALDELEVAATT